MLKKIHTECLHRMVNLEDHVIITAVALLNRLSNRKISDSRANWEEVYYKPQEVCIKIQRIIKSLGKFMKQFKLTNKTN